MTPGLLLDLNSLIPAASAWTLTKAYAMNSSGQIVRAGLFDDVETPLLTDLPAAVPEPSIAMPAGTEIATLFAL